MCLASADRTHRTASESSGDALRLVWRLFNVTLSSFFWIYFYFGGNPGTPLTKGIGRVTVLFIFLS